MERNLFEGGYIIREGEVSSHEMGLAEIDLGKICDDKAKFHDRYSPSWLSGEVMAANAEINLSGAENDEEVLSLSTEAAIDIKAKRQKAFDELAEKNAPELEMAGLGLELTRPIGFNVEQTGETAESDEETLLYDMEVFFKINSGKKFITYMDSLDKENLTAGQREGLEEVIMDLKWQLEQKYDISNPDDERAIQLLANLPEIITRMKGIPMIAAQTSYNLDCLEKYSKAAKEKFLREFLTAERRGLVSVEDLKEDNSGNLTLVEGKEHSDLANWHKEINLNIDEYRDNWNSAVKTAKEIGGNKNSKEFQRQFIEYLKKNLRIAKKDISENVLSADLTKKEILECRIIIDEAYDELEQIDL